MNRMRELVNRLNEAAHAYYNENREIMSNFEYDKLYDELVELERETGIVLANSVTAKVGYEVLTELPKEAHDTRMLSLDKTKEILALQSWLGDKTGLLSWKLDGLTIVLTYEDGALTKAITRGNGEIGEVVTANAKTFVNLPLTIPYKGRAVLRGEAVISYSGFERINLTIDAVELKYKNPRNLCSGSVRQLNSQITAKRKVQLYAFSLESAEGVEFDNSRRKQMEWLASLGFDTVEYKEVQAANIEASVKEFADKVPSSDLPSDGLVLIYDDITYGRSLGQTSKFPRDSIAFKWEDEVKDTVLREIEWSASRTGLINPIAILDPVQLEGTTVSRASLHNISIAKELELGIGDTVSVYKANMIIPQIAGNLTRSNSLEVPEECPVCGEGTVIKSENGVEALYCINPKCLAKQIKSFTLFVSRDAMNIEGLSEATIEKLIAKGLIKELADLFHVEKYKDVIIEMEGFGEKSFDKLCKSIDKARSTTVIRLLYSLGIPGIGLANAKLIARFCRGEWVHIEKITREELLSIDGIGDIIADNYRTFFDDADNQRIIKDVCAEVTFLPIDIPDLAQSPLFGKTFVITGALEHFTNRKELEELIEQKGGKSSGAVSVKTAYLINNDQLSSSSKNKKAQQLNIPIITELEFLEMLK